jgi:hypothetical protein
MNERIKELWEKAAETTQGDSWEEQTKFIERFAELIVQECIDIIAPYSVRMSRPGEEYLHPILEIRKHFGVEE